MAASVARSSVLSTSLTGTRSTGASGTNSRRWDAFKASSGRWSQSRNLGLSRCSTSRGSGSTSIYQGICRTSPLYYHPLPRRRLQSRTRGGVRANAESEGDTSSEKTPFGYTRKDVLLIGVGVIGAGFALKYGLEAVGVDSLVAGNIIQITFVLGLTVLWIFSYIFRVANKEMTYVKQLKTYEEEVMKKRLEELPEAELENMLAAVEEEKRRLEERRKARQQQ